MLTGEVLNPPVQYDKIWLIIGLLLLCLLPIWWLIILWVTRRRPYKAYRNFSQLPEGANLELLKKKYLQLIDEIYQRYTSGSITLREMHRQLSMTLRYFVYEAKRVPAPIMTLSDFRGVPYPILMSLVTQYYAIEFALESRGSAEHSIETAKGFIVEWV